ncbi:MAG: hypothetical protein WCA24_15260, partial [Thiomonas sp.]
NVAAGRAPRRLDGTARKSVANYKNPRRCAVKMHKTRRNRRRGSFATLFGKAGVYTLLNQGLVGRIEEKM